MVLAVLVLEEQEPLSRHLRQVLQVVVYLVNLRFDTCNQLVGLVFVELQDALHLDFQQLQDIVLRHLTNHLWVIRRQALVNMLTDSIHIGCLFKFLILIDALLYENLFQRTEMQLFEQLVLTDFQLLTDKVLRTVGRVAQHVADGEELRLVVTNDAAVGRDIDFAVGEGIERINGLVAADARRQMHLNLHLGRCQVCHVTRFNLALLNGLGDALAECGNSFRVRQLTDDERLRIELLNLGTHLQHAAALSVVVLADVDAAARLEVRIEVELLTVQVADGSVANLTEVMGQDF